MSETINFEEWLAEIERVESEKELDIPDAFTVRELRKRTGRGRIWINERIREAMEKGLVRCVRKRIVDNSGRKTHIPAYQLVKKETKNAKRKAN